MASKAAQRQREEFTTACGRLIRIGEFRVETGTGVRSRVTLDVGPEPGGRSWAWAGLTPGEARALAGLLLRQALQAEQDARPEAEPQPQAQSQPQARPQTQAQAQTQTVTETRPRPVR